MRYFSIGVRSMTEQLLRTEKYSVLNLSMTRGTLYVFQEAQSSVVDIAAYRSWNGVRCKAWRKCR